MILFAIPRPPAIVTAAALEAVASVVPLKVVFQFAAAVPLITVPPYQIGAAVAPLPIRT
jgi:hypothetical protein